VVREHLIEERYERFAGYQTRVLRVAGNGPPLLFLHGSATRLTPGAQSCACSPAGVVLAWRGPPSHGRADALDGTRPMVPQLEEFACLDRRAFGSRSVVDPRFALDYAGHVAPRLARRRLITLLYGLREEALTSRCTPSGSPARG